MAQDTFILLKDCGLDHLRLWSEPSDLKCILNVSSHLYLELSACDLISPDRWYDQVRTRSRSDLIELPQAPPVQLK